MRIELMVSRVLALTWRSFYAVRWIFCTACREGKIAIDFSSSEFEPPRPPCYTGASLVLAKCWLAVILDSGSGEMAGAPHVVSKW
jgi:hypothetical protein